MRGNAAVMRCLIPSFVADFVVVDSWVDDEGKEFFRDKNNDDGTVLHISMISPSSHPNNVMISFRQNLFYKSTTLNFPSISC